MPDTPTPVLAYDGRIGELYRIFLVNLLLTIATLGVWRFWAVTRMRRYLWSRTSSGGERFEYDGTGAQLFVGFLLGLLVIFGLGIAAALLSALLRRISPVLAALPLLAFELAILMLALGAPFSAQRYRLGHTIWRGIRGGMTGSMLAYGLRSLLYVLLVALTFFQLAPWASLRLLERRINASFIGTQRFASRGRPGQLYLRFLATFAGLVVLGVVVSGAFYVIEQPVFALLAHPASQQDAQLILQRLFLPITIAYLVFGLGATLISASFSAAFYRHAAGHTTLGGLHFASAVTAPDVLKLGVGNLLILLFTLGLGMPIILHRNTRFFAANLLATGMLDLATLHQGEQPISRYGEGMFQVLDAGAGIV